MLSPIMVCGAGRNGSSLIMGLLGSDPRCHFTRVVPYEIRYLTYIAKFAVLWSREDYTASESQPKCDVFLDGLLGIPPWKLRSECGRPSDLPTGTKLLGSLWQEISETILREHPGARWYAEKVPPWVPALLQEISESYTIYLFRDPRDVFLSTNSFMRKKNRLAFNRQAGDSDLDHAITLSAELLYSYENYRAQKHRADVDALKYEELVRDPEQATRQLREATGLAIASFGDEEFYLSHRTTSDVEHSIGRWRHEPIHPAVSKCLEVHLRQAMLEFGYTAGDGDLSENGHYIELSPSRSGAASLELSPHATIEEIDHLGARIKISGDDFYILPSTKPFNAEDVREVWVCMSGQSGNHCTLNWRDTNESFSDDRTIHVRYVPSNHYQIVRFDVRKNARWRGKIAQIKLSLFRNSTADAAESCGHIRWIRLVGHYD